MSDIEGDRPRTKVWVKDYDRKPDHYYYNVAFEKELLGKLAWTTSLDGGDMIEPSQWKCQDSFYCPGNYIVDRWGEGSRDRSIAWENFTHGYKKFLGKMPVKERSRLSKLGIQDEHLPSVADLRSKLMESPSVKSAFNKIFDVNGDGILDSVEIAQMEKVIAEVVNELKGTANRA